MSAERPPRSSDGRTDAPQNIATAIADVSERATLLVREEIELAKAEVSEKIAKLVKGAIVGAAAGIFFLMALIFALVGFAWLLYFYLPVNEFAFFWGFFAMAVILIVLGVLAGLIAAKVVKKGSPPVPTMAIAEAQKIREAVSAGSAAEASVSAPAKPDEGAPTAEAAFLANAGASAGGPEAESGTDDGAEAVEGES